MEEKKQFYKKRPNRDFKKKEEKFDVEKWLKQHQNIERPRRSKKNTLKGDRRKR